MLPALPPPLLSQILSHLLPPTLPLPHHLLAKPLIQRLIYLPPDEDDRDGHLNPLPAFGVAAELDRLAAVGFELVHVDAGLAESGSESGSKSQSQTHIDLQSEGVVEKGEGREVEYASDGESYFARVRVRAIGEGRRDNALEIKFVYEGEISETRSSSSHGDTSTGRQLERNADADQVGSEDRGWTYLSCLTSATPLDWKTDRSLITLNTPPSAETPSEQIMQSHGYGNGNSNGHGDANYDSTTGEAAPEQGYYPAHDSITSENTAPADYWADFSPPPANHLDLGEGEAREGGEEDYWAQYDQAFTPAAEGSRTPALRAEPSKSEGNARDLSQVSGRENIQQTTNLEDPSGIATEPLRSDSPTSPTSSTGTLPKQGVTSSAQLSQSDTLLRSRLSMKISSILRRAWLEFSSPLSTDQSNGYGEQGDREFKAIQWLSLGREIAQSRPSPSDVRETRPDHGRQVGLGTASLHNDGDNDILRAKLSVLREMYELVEDTKFDDAEVGGGEGFLRLVEGAMRGPSGNVDGDRGVKRVDSTAQLEYWE
jgi:hypothetical protein